VFLDGLLEMLLDSYSFEWGEFVLKIR
jgi:hypothetical protein